jgi:hypothetical protein
MPKELVFRSALKQISGQDPRTVEKSEIVEPIGYIEIGKRKFAVYDKAGIDKLTQQQKDQ